MTERLRQQNVVQVGSSNNDDDMMVLYKKDVAQDIVR
jgi:hypothetical protein